MTKPLGLYLHIPFCAKRCAYCSFYSAIFTEEMCDKYVNALKQEIEKWGGRIDRPIDTLYIGGGTPSLLGERIAEVVLAVKENFRLAEDAEITVELNPDSGGIDFLSYAKKAGVNRLSVGVQSGSDEMLKTLGRTHSANAARQAVSAAREMGFNNISVDLMLGLPDSSLDCLQRDIDFVCSLSPEHISAYILKLEEKTRLAASGTALPDDEQTAQQYLLMCELLKKRGFGQYEISNFCKPGCQSRHNTRYWLGEEYLGIGPAAHSFLDGERFYYNPDLKQFLAAPQIVSDGKGGGSEEKLMLGLRLARGVDLADFTDEIKEETNAFLKRLEKEKMITRNGTHISLTSLGMTVSNSIITELLYYEDL